jgi:hypothetical protein
MKDSELHRRHPGHPQQVVRYAEGYLLVGQDQVVERVHQVCRISSRQAASAAAWGMAPIKVGLVGVPSITISVPPRVIFRVSSYLYYYMRRSITVNTLSKINEVHVGSCQKNGFVSWGVPESSAGGAIP